MHFSLLVAAIALPASIAGAQQHADAPLPPGHHAGGTAHAPEPELAPAAVVGPPAVAELPRATVATSYPTGGRVVRVGARDNLQSAIDAARPGDVLLLPPGATYVGNFLLRNKRTTSGAAPAGGWIVIRTDISDAALGAEGTRMIPSRAATLRLARILSPNYDATIGTDAAAHHYRLTGVEISTTPAATQMNMIVRLGEAGDAQRTLASIPHHLVVDRSYVHGNSRLDLKRCVALNSATTAIVDSWLSECHSNNGDSQAVLGYNGPGPFKIQNNHLEAGHEVVMFGGADPSISGLSPSDIEIRGNHFFRPSNWRGVWQVKNLLETKNVRRLLVEGNVMENNWADAQVGFAFVLKSENQDGTAPWSTSSDITVRNNIIRHTGSAFNLAGVASSSNKVVPAARMLITNNVVEGVNVGQYTGDGIAFQILNGLSDAIITHNTILNQNSPQSSVVFDGPPANRLTMHSNVFFHGMYGVHGSDVGSGKATLVRYAPGAVFSRNAVVGGPCGAYPSGTVCPANVLSLGFAAALRGDYRATEGPLKGRGLDGGDIGADIDKLERATRGAVVAP
jgi:hypothetical protein